MGTLNFTKSFIRESISGRDGKYTIYSAIISSIIFEVDCHYKTWASIDHIGRQDSLGLSFSKEDFVEKIHQYLHG